MITVPLEQLPRQELKVTLGAYLYTITLKDVGGGLMCADIMRGDEVVASGVRLQPQEFLLSYEYQENGNFLFITRQDEYPHWSRFNVDQELVWISPEELARYG